MFIPFCFLKKNLISDGSIDYDDVADFVGRMEIPGTAFDHFNDNGGYEEAEVNPNFLTPPASGLLSISWVSIDTIFDVEKFLVILMTLVRLRLGTLLTCQSVQFPRAEYPQTIFNYISRKIQRLGTLVMAYVGCVDGSIHWLLHSLGT